MRNIKIVRPFDDLIYEDRYDNDEEADDDDEYDSEDSNQENHIGNDYPDEGDDRDGATDNDDDDDANNLVHGLNQFVFGDDDDDENDDEYGSLPSSEDEADAFYNAYRDPYVHAINADEENFCPDVDSCIADRYGMAYARYKARILRSNKLKTGDENDDDYEDDPEMRAFSDSSSDSCDYDAYYDTVMGDDKP